MQKISSSLQEMDNIPFLILVIIMNSLLSVAS